MSLYSPVAAAAELAGRDRVLVSEPGFSRFYRLATHIFSPASSWGTSDRVVAILLILFIRYVRFWQQWDFIAGCPRSTSLQETSPPIPPSIAQLDPFSLFTPSLSICVWFFLTRLPIPVSLELRHFESGWCWLWDGCDCTKPLISIVST